MRNHKIASRVIVLILIAAMLASTMVGILYRLFA